MVAVMDTLAATKAVVLQRGLVLRNEVQLVEGDDGVEYPVSVPVEAKIGEIIDVSTWASVGAYVNRGQIRLLAPSELLMLQQALDAEAAKAPSDIKKKGA